MSTDTFHTLWFNFGIFIRNCTLQQSTPALMHSRNIWCNSTLRYRMIGLKCQITALHMYQDIAGWVTTNAVDNFQRWIFLMKGISALLISRRPKAMRLKTYEIKPVNPPCIIVLLHISTCFYLPWVWCCCVGIRTEVGTSTKWLLPGIPIIKNNKTNTVWNPWQPIKDWRTIWSQGSLDTDLKELKSSHKHRVCNYNKTELLNERVRAYICQLKVIQASWKTKEISSWR